MRKRPIKISLRLNEQEHEHLKQQAALSGFPMEQFLRGLIADEKMRPRPPNEYADIGNNINQIARTVNARGFASQQDIDTVASAQREIWQMMEQL